MKKLILLLLLIVGCENSTKPEIIIALPVEMQLKNISYIYETSYWNDSYENYLLGVNPDNIHFDTLTITQTTDDYYIWKRTSNSVSSLVKNENNKLLLIGWINDFGVADFFDKPRVIFDFSNDFNKDSLNIEKYDYLPLFDRNTIELTVFENNYECYNFSSKSNEDLIVEQNQEVCQLGAVNINYFRLLDNYFYGYKEKLIEIINLQNAPIVDIDSLESVINIIPSTGCMLEDAPNYDMSALSPCITDCLNGQIGDNCCCEEIIYGCLDEQAINFSVTANAMCYQNENQEIIEAYCCIYE